ncbi:toll/interleukin-1 receptor domain-containing protein [Methylobacterium sp. SyP6R]|uniref:toll/interleukin-1 receptor domain-containing protein n=1 Tax=Methylobacterium sp. SyP6R TaxID=2718876 RepID=UPI001F4678E0|nr:toll/interleukin-1 receptor domain-containing protein [Methylobacterium sp. SyP6R]MCF4127618.1 toll/interleukin-1 receptor domain-containing protein [Methylobacterium sp. SyP6R]
MANLFISYSRADQDQVRPIVETFERAGLSVWWDELIDPGRRWSDALEREIDAADYVIAFLSRNVFASDNSYVAVEIERAHKQDKLIPVKIGEFTMSIGIEGVIKDRQIILTPNFDSFVQGRGFLRVCRLLNRGTTIAQEPKTETASDWLETGPSLDDLSTAIAIAVAESAPLATVTPLARDLERRLGEVLGAQAGAEKALGTILASRTKRLAAVGAVRYPETHGRLGIEIECVRFADPHRAYDLLLHVWDEFDGLRPALIDWLGHLTHTVGADTRLRIGLMIGTLARNRFASVYDNLIRPWMLDEHPATRDVADIALSIAVFDATLRSAVSDLVRDLTGSRDQKHLRAAVELACGYTGSRIEGLSLDVLKRVAQSKHTNFKVLEVMRAAVEYLVQQSMATEDQSLFNFGKLIGQLADWACRPDDGTPQRLPIYLFLNLMELLPLTAPATVDGLLSLQALMEREDTRNATAAVFEAALRDGGSDAFSPRESAQATLKNWQEEGAEADGPDPLLTLARAIYVACTTDRDRDRLVHTLRRRYTRTRLAEPSLDLSATPVDDA